MPTLEVLVVPHRFLFVAVSTLCTLACTSGWAKPDAKAPDVPPVLAFEAAPARVAAGGSVLLSWAAENVRVCEASGAWSGRRSPRGSERIDGVLRDSTFMLTCKDRKLAVSEVVAVVVDGAEDTAPVPSVTLTSSEETVPADGMVTLAWQARNADGCTASGAWRGDLPTSGSTVVGPLQTSSTYSLVCEGTGGMAYSAVTIHVQAVDAVNQPRVGSDEFHALLESVRKQYDLPGLAAVITRHGEIIAAGAAGVRALGESNAVTPADRWHLGSLTKAYTGTLAGILVERSFLSWDTRPEDVWPEMSGSIRPEYRDVTLRHLLSHTAGLPVDVLAVPSLRSLYDSAPGTMMQKRRLWAEELLAKAPEVSVGQYRYTNAGFIVAGAMLETVTGLSWEALLQGELFGPLGLAETGFGAPAPDAPWGHRTTSSGLDPVAPGPGSDNVKALGPAGTIHSGLADYARFMVAHLEGDRGLGNVVSAETYAFLHTPAPGTRYGIGWSLIDDSSRGGRSLVHAGSNTFWWAQVRLVPSANAGVFVAANAANSAAQRAVAELERALVDQALSAP